MLPFDCMRHAPLSDNQWIRHEASWPFANRGLWPWYSADFTGARDDAGSYVPDPKNMEYDGPVTVGFDIYATVI
jgi:hypothetical protein